tara:strand:- start:1209 stop:2033 length:825 start_codon:yes stop_codon:yes gene_type:complete
MSTIEVDKIKPQSGTALQVGESGDTMTVPSGATLTTTNATVNLPNTSVTNDNLAGSIANAKLTNSSITINGSPVSLGGSVTVGETKPTISSISPSVAENTQTAITITGSNFVSLPYVDAINSSTGSITAADSVTFTSSTTLVCNFTLSVDGTYYIRIENNDGNAVRSSTALLTVSDAPAWVTAAGSLGTTAAATSINYTVSATDATSYAIQSGALPGGGSLNTATGAITGTETGSTATTTYNFTIRATDAQAQTADRAFSITISHGISNGGQFN